MPAEPISLSSNRPGADHAESPDHACACGHEDASRIVLDARTIPHAIRHASIFGALDAIRPGFALDLVAPHDPLPLLAQLERNRPGDFLVSYVERGPEAWTVRLTRAQ